MKPFATFLATLSLLAASAALATQPRGESGVTNRLEKPASPSTQGSTNRLEQPASSKPQGLQQPAAGSASAPEGATWRYPEKYAPFAGPAELSLTPAQVASVVDPRRLSSKSAPIPELIVQVVGKDARPVPGVEVRVGLKGTKKDAKALRYKGATDANGTFALRPQGALPMQKLAIDMAWDGGYKIVGVDLEPKDGKWGVARAPIKNSVNNSDEGSCSNFFRFEPAASAAPGRPAFRLLLQLPGTLLECRKVEYGIERKADQLVKVDAIGHRDINEGDKNFFSESDEAKMGLEAADKFDKELELVQDPAILGYVTRVMEKVVAASDDPALKVRVRVANSDAVNAFCTAGGNVYVFTGLIKAAQDEAMLAGVLAHEFSHAVAHHVTEGATRQMKAQLGTVIGTTLLGAATGMSSGATESLTKVGLTGAGVLGLKYDKRYETEADLLGEQYLWKAGWDPEAIARFFQLLKAQDKGGQPPAWLSTHPSHEDRIGTGIHWARAFLPPKDRYLVNTAAFDDCKRRVQALPKPVKKAAP